MRLSTLQENEVARLYLGGFFRASELAGMFGITRQTVTKIARRRKSKLGITRKEKALATDIAEGMNETLEIGHDPEKDTRVSHDQNEGDK